MADQTPITDAEREQRRKDAERVVGTPAAPYGTEFLLRLLAENDALRARLAAMPEATETVEAAQRVNAWLDSNWKYVSDDLGRDLRLLASAANAAPSTAPADQCAPRYEPVTRRFVRPGYTPATVYSGGVARPGSKRATALCKHDHLTELAAHECAEQLVSLRGEEADRV